MPSIFSVDPSDVESFTVVTNPIRTYSSSSTHGVTGSVNLFARRSHTLKDAEPNSSFVSAQHDDSHIAESLRQAQWFGRTARFYPSSGSYTSGSYSSGSYATGSVVYASGPFRFLATSDVLFTGSYTNLTGTIPNTTTGLVLTGSMSGSYVPQSLNALSASFYITGTTTAVVSGTALFTGTLNGINPGTYALTGTFVPAAHADALLFSGTYAWSGSNFVPTGTFTPRGFFVPTSRFLSVMGSYLDKVTQLGTSTRLQQVKDVHRFTPPADLDSNTLRKLIVKDSLQSYYVTSYPSAHWAYTNYNSLNFFTASSVPSNSAILYPNINGGTGGLVKHDGYFSGTYTPSGSFSFDFYINPRYQQDAPNGDFKAGTILHLSSTFALSLISGSAKDASGRTIGYRLQLQLSHSADVAPSAAVPGNVPQDLIFRSDDNALSYNHWHHVVVRWGTQNINNGVGTFNVDGVDRGTFTVPSSTITPRAFGSTSTKAEATVLVVGNFFEGNNVGNGQLANFFAADPALRDGLNALIITTGLDEPSGYSFNHPLNAELHDVAIRRCYMSNADIAASASVGPVFLDNTFAFYLPPFFTSDSPYRQFVGTHGGILVTPFQEVNGSTTAPFSVALSFGVGGHYINLENFVKDLASNVFPRLHRLTGSALQGTTTLQTANQFLYGQPSVAKRNLTILPCDDGLFVPSFQLLASQSHQRALDSMGNSDLSLISIDNLVMSSTLLFGPGTSDDGTQPASTVNAFSNLQLGSTPETPFASIGPAYSGYTKNLLSGSDVEAGAPLTIYQRTQDPSSNQVTFFDISNMFYGFRIKPGSFVINDPSLSGSAGAVKLTLADDGLGNLYRADCFTSQSTWNSVGNLYCNEGVAVIKSPHAFFFGQENYNISMRGEQHVHVMKIDALAPNNQLNSSSNPNYVKVAPNGFPNDPEGEFVYITGINFHDSDYNVVMKTSLAQPIMKRPGDRINFKVKFDW